MLKAFKYSIQPTPQQKELIERHIGCCRLVYNLAFDVKRTAHQKLQKSLSVFDLNNQLPELKKELPWLKEVNSQSLQQTIADLGKAFDAFFRGNGSYPKFKSKKDKCSFRIPSGVNVINGELHIPKFKDGIRINLHRPMKGEIRQATITRTPTGKYFASILCETGEVKKTAPAIKEQNTVGIDLGLKDYATISNGQRIENSKYLRKSLSKLRFLQRRVSNYKGKRNKRKLSKLHEKVANQRNDFLHQVTTELIRDNQSIALENLNVKGMIQNKKLSKSIADAAWGSFVRMLEYKADWYGVNIIKIGRFEASSKTCYECKSIYSDLTLNEREWTCKECGVVHDRDLNASHNIKHIALTQYRVLGTHTENRKELPAQVGAMTFEAQLSLVVG